MPTLTRLIIGLTLAILAGYGVIYALATFVTPETRNISVPVLERDQNRK